MYYSAIGVLAILILFIVNWDILYEFRFSSDKPAWNVYRRFLFVVLMYYITDALWGVLEDQKLATALFVDTTIYFVVMAVGISFWAEYTVAYLGEKSGFGRFLVYTGRFIAGAVGILAIVNIFTPVLFTVDKKSEYNALPARYVILSCQILFLLIISVYALVSKIREGAKGEIGAKYRILASFGIIMVLCLFAQLWFPYLPLYAIAYMLGTTLLHAFVVNDEKDAYKHRLEDSEKITELKDRFASLLDNMPGMTFTKDAKTGVFLACNQAFADYAHKESPAGVVGLTDAEIFDAETAAHFVQDDRIALSLSKPYVFYEDVPDAAGSHRQLQTTKVKFTDTAGRLCVLGMCQDVTDMVRIQHENAMTKEAYENAVSTGLMYTNIAQTLARDYTDLYYINADTEEFVQYCKGEGGNALSEVRRGWHFFSDCKEEMAESVYSEDREEFLQAMKRKTLMKALDRKDTFIMTYRQMSGDKWFYVNMKISRMHTDDAEDDGRFLILGITNVDAEMRETMAKSEALAEALTSAEEANKAKTSFLSGMSHEIRTPMNAIIGLDMLALKKQNLDTETRDYLEKIGDSAQNLLSIINDILDMSRIESGRVTLHKEDFSFSDLMEQISTMVMSQCREKGITFDFRVQASVDENYYGDVMKLREVLLNILSNAVKFTEAPGSITMTVEKTAERDDQTTLRFLIKDTGIGMDKEYLPRIFDSFSQANTSQRTKFGSSGLGMAITKRIVEMMGGSISVESEKGKGTEFDVTVVLQKCDPRNMEKVGEIDLSALFVLVVDDDPIEAEHARVIMGEVGIRADACTSGQEALRKMEVQRGKQDPYNMILMDWNMPGMSGPETAAEIQKQFEGENTVVALTAYSWDDIAEEAHKVGVNSFMPKPLFPGTLVESFERIARRSNMAVFKKKKQAKLAGRRILLAEDMELNADILTDILEMENVKVDHAENGKIAVELFEKSTAGIYAAILMDVRMPEMDGLEATKEIRSMSREDAKKIPIIALTANTFDEDVQQSIQAGMNAHLTKPIEADNLFRTLGELIYEAENS